MKVTFVAAPLTARSGVYRSGRELVAAGREQGHEWSLVLGVSQHAHGSAPVDDPEWIHEFAAEPSGPAGIIALRRTLLGIRSIVDADIVVSLIPQTDMVLALTRKRWVAFVRGLPWPAAGESSAVKRLIWKTLEAAAFRRAEEVWATTTILRADMGHGSSTKIVPAGIASVARAWDGSGNRDTAVWAARFHTDKNPALFLAALRGQDFAGRMHGVGSLEQVVRADAPTNVDVAGWTSPDALWQDAFAYVGTSHREAFGRSALEAAMAGVPVVISDSFGVADMLVTDDDFLQRFVLPNGDLDRWRQALADLHDDESLRRRYSEHLVANAQMLTIEASAAAVAERLRAIT
ncbi:MAG: glycosyltransferase family 4 protein [Microbacterium gubbeenense]|uniref:glycosyltransferase family 4 protein n=1 Tax=Microbacterium gubbeenense TaxID=159896 RepID=UPI003F97DDC0